MTDKREYLKKVMIKFLHAFIIIFWLLRDANKGGGMQIRMHGKKKKQ